jgi:hypothetical protein
VERRVAAVLSEAERESLKSLLRSVVEGLR